MRGQPRKKQTQDDDYSKTLYVIFHGAIAFYDDPGVPWIEAMLVDLKDDHVYTCGKFLGETRIPRSAQLSLTKVNEGEDSFSNYAAFVHYTGVGEVPPGAKVHLDSIYARFTFPRPKRIIHALNFTTLDGGSPGGGRAPKLCVVPVFQYTFDSVDDVRLRMFLNYGAGCAQRRGPRSKDDFFPWMPTKGDVLPLTLHVHAEEDADVNKDPSQDHAAALEVLQDTTNTDITVYKNEDRETVPGLGGRTPWEIDLSFRKRTEWLETYVGQVIERKPPAAGKDFTIKAPKLFSDHDASCGGESGGPV